VDASVQAGDLTVDFDDSPAGAAFRAEVRDWLADNLPADGNISPQEWRKRMYDGRWIGATWPVEYGGRGLDMEQAAILSEEFARADAPDRADDLGEVLVGPTILVWGTDEQKAKYLPPILRGEAVWCQGFSEPDSGSDLASLRTRAVQVGDEWSVTGQKVWTSHAHAADQIFVLARTAPDAPKHAGISFLLMRMDQPGIVARPMLRIDGSPEFCEVFFDDARCSLDDVVGPVDAGWKVATTTLQHERGTSATSDHWRFQREWRSAVATAVRRGTSGDPVVRQQLASAWTSVQLIRFNGLRMLSKLLAGSEDVETAALGSMTKLFWTEWHQRFTDDMVTLEGMDGLVLTGSGESDGVGGVGRGHGSASYPVSRQQADYFFARSETIWGGTSQIQRNIIAERVLGLPREPR
jgi:alkylation response protein AidB-like acyl-CoA dehydrogenase